MKIGFCLHKEWIVDSPDLIRRLDELGYDGVEVWAQGFEKGGLEGVQAALAPYSLEVISVNPYFDFTTSEDTYAESQKIADRYIEYARALDCHLVRAFTSKMRSIPTSDDASPDQWERAIRGLTEICDRAAPEGITLVLEVHYGDGQLMDTSAATLRILEGVGRRNLTVNLQPLLRGETQLESAERLGPQVTHLHANAWKGEWGNFTFMDEGDEDFEALLRAVRSHGFDGCVSIEHASSDPIGFAEHNIVYLRSLFEKLEGHHRF